MPTGWLYRNRIFRAGYATAPPPHPQDRKDVIDLTDFFRMVPLVELHEARTVLCSVPPPKRRRKRSNPDQNAAASRATDSDERQWYTGW